MTMCDSCNDNTAIDCHDCEQYQDAKRDSRIERAVKPKYKYLDMAGAALLYIEMEHECGTDWVCVDTLPAIALGVLQKLEMIQVIKFNDKCHYAQINGAIKDAR